MRSRDPILEATRTVIGRAGFAGVTIAAVAKEARVSRQTVYSIFGTREELISQAVSEQFATLTGAFTDAIETAESPADVIVEIAVVGRQYVRRDPVLRALTLYGESNPMFDARAADRSRKFAASLMAPALERFPAASDQLDFIADICAHVGWSVLWMDSPEDRSDEELRGFLNSWLDPLLGAYPTGSGNTDPVDPTAGAPTVKPSTTQPSTTQPSTTRTSASHDSR